MKNIITYFILFILSASELYAQNYYEGDSLQVLGTNYELRHYDYGDGYPIVGVENSQNNFDETYRYREDDYYCVHLTRANLAELHQIMREVFTPSQIVEYRQDSTSHSLHLTCLTDLSGNMLGVRFSLYKHSKVSPEQLRQLEQRIMFNLRLSVHCDNFPQLGSSATFVENGCNLSFRDL